MTNSTSTIASSIIVIDDHPIVRHGLVQLLRRVQDFKVCGQAGDARSAWNMIELQKPDIVLLDLFLKGLMVLDLIQKIKTSFPEMKVLVISLENEGFIAERALAAGADGFILKEEATRKIVEALRMVRENKSYISEPVFQKMLHQVAFPEGNSGNELINKLSQRELQTFFLLGKGKSSQEISELLSLNIKTVETYYSRIKEKMAIKNIRELTRVAIQYTSKEI